MYVASVCVIVWKNGKNMGKMGVVTVSSWNATVSRYLCNCKYQMSLSVPNMLLGGDTTIIRCVGCEITIIMKFGGEITTLGTLEWQNNNKMHWMWDNNKYEVLRWDNNN